MFEAIMEAVVRVLTALVLALISVGGTWILRKIGDRVQTANIRRAVEDVIRITQMTVGELQQTVVEGLKAAHEDGKLTETEVKALQETLLNHVAERLSDPVCNLIEGAGIDIESVIQGAAEDWINSMKSVYGAVAVAEVTAAD